MTISNWVANVSGDWNTASLWSGGIVPNAVSADVTIDATATLVPYTVTIAAGETETVDSLSMNAVNNRALAEYPYTYIAAELELDGTLIFAAGSAGSLAGSGQTLVHVAVGKQAAILNGGTLNAFIQVAGSLLLTGTNGVYISNEIQALGGSVTINAPIAEYAAGVLFDGFFDAHGSGSVINLGGTHQIVSIATLEGPSFGWSELSLNGVTAAINEWNGTAYTSVESTLTTIGDGATLDVLGGRNYTTANSLTIDEAVGSSVLGTMLNLQAGTISVGGGIDINHGVVQGYGTIVNNVVNNSTLIALGGSVGGTLDLIGNLTGTGGVTFDLNAATGVADPTPATLVLHSVSAGQTITLNDRNDILFLAAPSAFSGTIAAVTGGQIVLQGLSATRAVLTNGTLVVSNGSSAVASLILTGTYTNDSFTATGSVVTVGAPISPSIAGTAAHQAISDQQTIAPFANVVIADRNFRAQEAVTVTLLAPANGTLTNLGGGVYNATTGVYTTSGTPAAVSAALDGLVFVPTLRQVAPGGTLTTAFTISDLDTFSQTVSDSTTSVITTASAAAPTISGALGGQAINGPGTLAPFAQVVIGDVNFGQTETVTVTPSSAAAGTLTPLPGIGTYSAGTGVYTVTGSAAVVTAALNGLVFTPTVTPDQTVTTDFSILDVDTASQTARNATTSVTATFNSAPPTITVNTSAQATTDLATITPFAGAVVTDTNIGQAETLMVTLSPTANGTLTNLDGGSYVGGVYTIVGAPNIVSSALAGLVFVPTAHQVLPGGAVTTQFVISDTDTALQHAVGATATVIATAGTVAPTILHTAAAQTISDRGTIAPFAQVVIGDANFGQTETVTVTLAIANGTLTNLGAGSYNAVTGVYTVRGTAASVSAVVDGLLFVPTPGEVAPGGTVATRFTISDVDTSLASVTDSTTTVIATAGTVLPTITGTAANQTATDQATVTPFAHVVIADTNFGQTETVTVTLFSGANGTLTPLANTGTLSAGAYTLVGSASAVTTALDGLVFTPTLHQVAPGGSVITDFTIHDTDTASQTVTDVTTSVAATAVAVPPVITGTRAGQAITDQGTIIPFSTVAIADANFGQTETVTVTLSATANGTLSNLAGGAYTASTGVFMDVGAASAVTAALDGLVFTPTFHQVALGGTVATTFTIRDVDTASQSATDPTTTVIATATASLPTISGTLAGQRITDQTTITPLGAVVIADGNPGQTETVTVTLSARANGTLTNLGTGGSYNAATGVYTDTGTASAVTTALNGLVFTPTPHQIAPGGTVTTTFTIQDTDTVGTTSSNTSTSVIVAAGTVSPTINGALAGQRTTDQGTITPFATVVIADANFGQTETVTVRLSAPANGILNNPNAGAYNAATGVYTVSGSAVAVTAALNTLVFTPTPHQIAPGGTVVTSFTIVDTDTASQAARDSTTAVIATALATQPTISGAQAGKTVTDEGTITPLASLVIADGNLNQTEAVTVSLSAAANGTLSNLGGGSYNASTGVYTITGTAGAVTTALNNLVFTPTPQQVTPGATVTTTFSVQDVDTAGASATNATTTVIAIASSTAIVNEANGTSFLVTFDPISTVTRTISEYSSLNATGLILVTIVDNTDGTSYLYSYNLSSTVKQTTDAYTGLDDTGAKFADVVNYTSGTTLVYAYNPASTVSQTAQLWSATNPISGASAGSMLSNVLDYVAGTVAIYQYNPTSTVTLTVTQFASFSATTGAPTGPQISDVIDNSDGSSILYTYNPTSTVTQTASVYSGTNSVSGAPAGNVTSQVIDFTDGTSILYTFYPTPTVSQTASFYSSSNPTSGAPTGTQTLAVFDFTGGTSILYNYNPSPSVTQIASFYSSSNPISGAVAGNLTSQVTNYAAGGSSVTTGGTTTYYTGPNGTGSVTSGLPSAAGAPALVGSAPTTQFAQPESASDPATITFVSSDQIIDPGAGDHTIQFISGQTADTLMLHAAGTDQVFGFDPTAGDVLDFSALLNESNIDIGDDISQLAAYVSVVDDSGSAGILFNPTGQGGGSEVALLVNDGAQVPQLQSFKSFSI